VPTRPSDSYWQNEAPPNLWPGLNDRENAVKDYAEALSSEMPKVVKTGSFTLAAEGKGKTHEATSSSAIVVTVPERLDLQRADRLPNRHRRPLLQKRAAGVAGSIGACAIRCPRLATPSAMPHSKRPGG
jgi:hypothetical protein